MLIGKTLQGTRTTSTSLILGTTWVIAGTSLFTGCCYRNWIREPVLQRKLLPMPMLTKLNLLQRPIATGMLRHLFAMEMSLSFSLSSGNPWERSHTPFQKSPETTLPAL